MVLKRFSVAVATIGVVALTAPTAMALPIVAERSATVRLSDVDANSEAGARVLLRRIERAASRVCGESLARRYVSLRRDYRICRARTMASTIERIGAERLQAEYAARYGRS